MSRSCHSATSSTRGLGVAAQHAREAGDALGGDRVALVRHRARALLARAERLLDLAHLGALQVADLGREALEPGAGERDRLQQLGVAVARDDLGGDGLGAEAERARARAPRSPARASRTCRRRRRSRRSRPGRTRARAARALRCASKAKPASLSPNDVGSAWTPCVRPTHSVPACSRARSASAAASSRAPGHDHVARRGAAAARARCRARRRTSARSGSSARPRPPRRRARRRTRRRRGR